METNNLNDQNVQEEILSIFNVSGENDDIRIELDENFEPTSAECGRRC